MEQSLSWIWMSHGQWQQPPTCGTRIINMYDSFMIHDHSWHKCGILIIIMNASWHTFETLIINMDESWTVATPPLLPVEHALSIGMSHDTHMEQSLSWIRMSHGQWQHPPYNWNTRYKYACVMTHIWNNHYHQYGWGRNSGATPPTWGTRIININESWHTRGEIIIMS